MASPLQRTVVDGFLHALCEPRFQTMVEDFHAIRDKVTIGKRAVVSEAIQFLLATLQHVLRERHAVAALEDGADAVANQLEEAIACVDNAAEFALGSAFPDIVTFLCLLQRRVKITEPRPMLMGLDDTLALVGMSRVSLIELWDSADEAHRTDLWNTIRSLMNAIETECTVTD